MTFQEMSNIIKSSKNFPYAIEIVPYVYEENDTVNTVVFEFGKVILTIHSDGTYTLDKTENK
jgi:ArsR family metal-binding transcriptional regulator